MAASKSKTQKTPDATAGFNPLAPKVWQDIMTESVRFMTDRLQKDMETQKAMLSCTSPAELIQLQTEFFQQALSDYTDEAARMHRLMSQAGGAKRGYDDVPL